MGLIDAFWKRSQSKDEREEREREKLERKTSKATEEVVASIGDIRVEDRQLAEFDKLTGQGQDKTGLISWVASLTRLTRGTHDVLDEDAQAWLGWIIRRAYVAYQEGNEKIYKFCAAELMEIFGIVVPMLSPKAKPDIYTLPYIQKPGGNMPPQNAGIPPS